MMISCLTIFTYFTVLLAFINADPCRFENAKGVIDLTSLGKTDGKPAYPDKLPPGSSYKYSYNPCRAFSEPSNCIGVAACQISLDGMYSFDIGKQESAIWNPGATGGFPSVTYSSADGQKITIIQLQCSKDGSSDFDALGEGPTNTYKFRLTDKCACWGGCSAGPTSTSITTTVPVTTVTGTTVTGTTVTGTTVTGTTGTTGTTPAPQQNCSINGSIYTSDKDVIQEFPFPVSINPSNTSLLPAYSSYAIVDIYGRVNELTLAGFESIPTAVFCLQNLKSLSLINSVDILLPPEILRLGYTLESLILSNISKSLILPPALFSMGRLLKLSVINSGLEILSEEISSLSKLTELNLDQNKLISLPTSLGRMTSLTYVSVNDNPQLSSLDALNGLTSLTELQASYCSIDHLPTNLANIMKIELNGNQLKSLDGLETITSEAIVSLSFANNTITSISNTAIGAVNIIRYLNLAGNELTTLPDAIYRIENLKTLNINNNGFSKKEIEWIQGLFRLTNTSVIV